MSGDQREGPNDDAREKPASTETNPAGTSAQEPAEGSDDVAPPTEGSPTG